MLYNWRGPQGSLFFYCIYGGRNVRFKIMFEWLSWILLSLVMFSGGMYVAFAAPFLIVIAPLPFMVLGIRQGFRESLLGVMFGSASALMMWWQS